jgi:hypothetical protein
MFLEKSKRKIFESYFYKNVISGIKEVHKYKGE